MLKIKVKCPTCGEVITSWVVTTPNVPDSKKFKCLSCYSTLKSNHESSLRKAIIIGIIFNFRVRTQLTTLNNARSQPKVGNAYEHHNPNHSIIK